MKKTIHIPSKTFLIGEYGVLSKGSCLLHLHEPYYKVSSHGVESVSFHPKSPAGILTETLENKVKFSFEDPYNGSGGFGGSTAEVIAVLKMSNFSDELKTNEAYSLYMDLFKNNRTKPSGADFYGQYSCLNKAGQTLLFHQDKSKCELLNWPFKNISILIFKRDKKIQTQNHLDSLKLKEENIKALKEITQKAIVDFRSADINFFLKVDEFTQTQHESGLLLNETLNDLKVIKSIDGVVTARGCGALGADVITVFYDRSQSKGKILNSVIKTKLQLKSIDSFN